MATIKDVAQLSGVSTATVSRVINGLGGYSDKTREKVNLAIQELQFQRNEIARSLIENRSKSIGVVMPNLSTDVANKIMEGIEDTSFKNDYMVLVAHAGINLERLDISVTRLLERRVEGIVFLSTQITKPIVNQLDGAHVPYIVTGTFSDDRELYYPYVKIDDYQAAVDATNLILNRGYRKIAILGGIKDDFVTSHFRVQGVHDTLKRRGVPYYPELTLQGSFSFAFGASATNRLLSEKSEFDAIFCLSDEVASAAVQVLVRNGISVPRDIGVIGFDDSKTSLMSIPRLTTIHQPLNEIGVVATQKVIDAIKVHQEVDTEIIATKIVQRESL
ncbi:LacI family DNA-binding transcriptional regulator [Lacticaseibacillus manihotivorans]|uniref:PurR family transcriptional regulator n=1 Tax=Lacticaseibacillus manihotivorans DSM 13343 = JCM 12514 TaxID=1423769 RepID=A0A0R1QIB0_9LACO|nr:LacI family DNA-binding transcriptional regulator [Lacticaseibacillus manihotivorans]KRL44289.1 PurR family transcriptional regulator [Lacticaseibacillus manihotivorans DSM 13343 = JCM 12514]